MGLDLASRITARPAPRPRHIRKGLGRPRRPRLQTPIKRIPVPKLATTPDQNANSTQTDTVLVLWRINLVFGDYKLILPPSS